MVLQGYYAMGKTPIKHTLAGYIIKKTDTPKDTGQEN